MKMAERQAQESRRSVSPILHIKSHLVRLKEKKNLSVSKPAYGPVPCSWISDHDAVYTTVNVCVSKFLPRHNFIRNFI